MRKSRKCLIVRIFFLNSPFFWYYIASVYCVTTNWCVFWMKLSFAFCNCWEFMMIPAEVFSYLPRSWSANEFTCVSKTGSKFRFLSKFSVKEISMHINFGITFSQPFCVCGCAPVPQFRQLRIVQYSLLNPQICIIGERVNGDWLGCVPGRSVKQK